MASPSPPKPWERGTPTGKSTHSADFSIPCTFTSQRIHTFLKPHRVHDTRNLYIRTPTPPFETLNPQLRRQSHRLKLHTIQQTRLWHLTL